MAKTLTTPSYFSETPEEKVNSENQLLDEVRSVRIILEKFYSFLTVTDSQSPASSVDGKTYRHRLHYGGYFIERVIDGRLALFYEDESQTNRIELHKK